MLVSFLINSIKAIYVVYNHTIYDVRIIYSHLKITVISLFDDLKWILSGMPALRPPNAWFREILKFLEPRAQKI